MLWTSSTIPKSMDAKSSWLKTGQRDAAAVARDPAVGAESPDPGAVLVVPAAEVVAQGLAVTPAAGLAASPGPDPNLVVRTASPSLKTRTRMTPRKHRSLGHARDLGHVPSLNHVQDHPMTAKTTLLKPTETPRRKRMMKIEWFEFLERCVRACVKDGSSKVHI